MEHDHRPKIKSNTVQTNLPKRVSTPISSSVPSDHKEHPLSSDDIVRLQATYGNQTVMRMIDQKTIRVDVNKTSPYGFLSQSDSKHNFPTMKKPYHYHPNIQVLQRVGKQATESKAIWEPKKQFYGHGAFMGAYNELWNDNKWNKILESLMPKVYADLKKGIDPKWYQRKKTTTDLAGMMENNPVMAAFGTWKTKELDDKKQDDRTDRVENLKAIEWDIWLDPDLVTKYKNAINQDKKKDLAD